MFVSNRIIQKKLTGNQPMSLLDWFFVGQFPKVKNLKDMKGGE